MALSTKTLDALNDSRKTEPHKYIWGQFTPDKEGVGYSDLPEQTNIPDDANLVLDVNGPSLVRTDIKSIQVKANKDIYDKLDLKVNKSGDSMSGDLVFDNEHGISLGQNYILKSKDDKNQIQLFDRNGRGIYLDGLDNDRPYYTNGDASFRLLSESDITSGTLDYLRTWGNIVGKISEQTDLTNYINQIIKESSMLGRMDFNNAVTVDLASPGYGSSYTIPNNGYLYVRDFHGESVKINNVIVMEDGASGAYQGHIIPVSKGDVVWCKLSSASDPGLSSYFIPQY